MISCSKFKVLSQVFILTILHTLWALFYEEFVVIFEVQVVIKILGFPMIFYEWIKLKDDLKFALYSLCMKEVFNDFKCWERFDVKEASKPKDDMWSKWAT